MYRFISTSLLSLVFALIAWDAHADNMTGAWVGNVTCRGQYIEPQPWPLTVNVVGANGNYTVAAATPNSAGGGTISGNRVTFTMQVFLNTAHFTGTIVGNRMSGRYVQGGSGPCDWFAIAPGTGLAAPSTPPAQSKEPGGIASTIGVTGTVTGKVTILTRDGRTVIANSGTPFRLGDTIETGPTGRAQILLKDDTIFTVGPKSKIVMDEFIYNPSNNTSNITARMLVGFFRWISGRVYAKPPEHTLRIGLYADLGIRGTEFEVEMDSDNSGYVKLYSGEVIFISKSAKVIVTISPGQMISFDQFGKPGEPRPF